MKVLFDSQIFRRQRYGGISRYFVEIAARLDRLPGMHATVAAPMHINAYVDALPAPVYRGFRAPAGDGFYHGRRAACIASEAAINAVFRPDIVHETYYDRSARGRRGAARVLTIYDMIHERFPSQFAKDDQTAELKAVAARRADHIICISEATRRDVIEFLGIPEHRLSVTHLADNFAPSSDAGASARQAGQRPFLLHVGERSSYKNFWPLLQAVQASPALADFDVVCFGGGDFTERDWRRVDEIGFPRERLLYRSGGDAELTRAYRAAHCFIYPSLYEGFGLPPLEAMANDCPVVCSDTSSIPEVVGPAGESFDPSDVDSMRRAVERVALSDTRRAELVRAGRERRARFSWDRCARETADVYRRLAA